MNTYLAQQYSSKTARHTEHLYDCWDMPSEVHNQYKSWSVPQKQPLTFILLLLFFVFVFSFCFFLNTLTLSMHFGLKKNKKTTKQIYNSCLVETNSQCTYRKNHLSHLPNSFRCKAAAALVAVCVTLCALSSYFFVKQPLKFTFRT